VLPDARIAGSLFLGRSQKKSQQLIKQKGNSARSRQSGQNPEAQVCPWVVQQCSKQARTPENRGYGCLSSGRPAWGSPLLVPTGRDLLPGPQAQPCVPRTASDRIRFCMEIASDDLLPGVWEGFGGRHCVGTSVSRPSWKHLG
jgi:hypothetical protein